MRPETLLEKARSIIIIGVGGTGSFLLTVLLRYLNSRSDVNQNFEVIIVDGDKYEEKNVNRQEFAHSRIGRNKADVQAEVYGKKFPNLRIVSVPKYLGEENIKQIIGEHSVVFCCVDNHKCRYMVSLRCQELNDTLLISGGNEEFDGNIQSYCREAGEALNNPIEVRHPEIKNTDDGDRSKMSCEELSTLPSGSQFIGTNSTAGNMMFQLMFGYENQTPGIENVNDIYFDIRQVKTMRIVNGQPE